MTKNSKQYIPIFVSSTYKDLIPYRKAALNILDKLKVAVKGMEVFGARTKEPLETCLSEVEKCDVFIGIIGMMYGSIDKKTGKSFVQREYETAVKELQDIQIYLIDEERALLPPKLVDIGESAKKLREFKEHLGKRHTLERFKSPEDLAAKLDRDLRRLFSEKDLTIDKERLKPSAKQEEIIDILKKFDLMPARYAGSEIELICRFSGPVESVPEDLCKAINLRFGQSLSRPITIKHPPNISTDFRFLEELYAEYEGCDFLYSTPEGEDFKIIAKLVLGYIRSIVWEPAPNSLATRLLRLRSTKLKDLETGEVFENYITYGPVRALILIKIVRGKESKK